MTSSYSYTVQCTILEFVSACCSRAIKNNGLPDVLSIWDMVKGIGGWWYVYVQTLGSLFQNGKY